MDEKQDPSGERTFLHDISNQLVVAQGMGAYVFKVLKDTMPADSKELQRMEKTINSINKMVDMVKARRDTVRAQLGVTE